MEKKYLKIGLILIFCFIVIFGSIKFLSPKKPPQPPVSPLSPIEILSPEEVAMKYFSLVSEKNHNEAEKYLFSDFSVVEIFGEKYHILRANFWSQPKEEEKEGLQPEYRVINKEIKENEAKITLEMTANKIENTLFFIFYLPKEVLFKIDLIKEGGYWKIIKIDSPDLILEKILGEEVEIKENIFIKVIKIGDYYSKDIKPSEIGNKLLFLEAEYENKSNRLVSFFPYNEWRIVSQNEVFYYGTPGIMEGVSVLDISLIPDEIKKIKIFFEVFEDFSANKVIFQNLDKKVIFKID